MEPAIAAATSLKTELSHAIESYNDAETRIRSAQRQCQIAANDKNEAIAEAAQLNGHAKKLKAVAQEKAVLSNASIEKVDAASAETEKAVLKVKESQADADKAVERLAEKVAEMESLDAEAKKSAELASSAAQAADESDVRVSTATTTANTCNDMLQQRISELHLANTTVLALKQKISSIVGILNGKTTLLDFVRIL
jgi:DNA repair exonuclease SbcCD ATPase subunit